jgi:transportin-1
VEQQPESLLAQLDPIIQFMLQHTQNDDDLLSMEAADFWLITSEADSMHLYLQPYLSKILPVLLKMMVYSEDDLFMLERETLQDEKDQDIKPRFHSTKVHGQDDKETNEDDEDDDDYDEDDEEDYDDEWNIRKCCAAALDTYATAFGDDLLTDLIPCVNQMLNNSDWTIQEAGILALGAVAQGCSTGMKAHLPGVISHFLAMLNHERPLLRSITSWTLSRYMYWICHPPQENYQVHVQQYFLPSLQHTVRLMLDSNRQVQKSACSCLASIIEEGFGLMTPYLDTVCQAISRALTTFQRKNLLALYDTIGTLAEFGGQQLNIPTVIQILVPSLISKFESTPEEHDLFPLLECISFVAIALGQGFKPFAPTVFERCVMIIDSTMQKIHEYKQGGEVPDKDFLIVGLDLLGALVQALGNDVVPLLQHRPLEQVMKMCMVDETGDVRSCVFALLGDMAQHCFPYLLSKKQDLHEFIELGIRNLESSDAISAINNACWSLGEVLMRTNEFGNLVHLLLSKLIPLVHANTAKSIRENVCITLGRLGIHYSDIVAPFLDQFVAKWYSILIRCEITYHINTNLEKQSSFEGMLQVISKNPQPVIPHFGKFVDGILKWEPENPMRGQFTQVEASHLGARVLQKCGRRSMGVDGSRRESDED